MLKADNGKLLRCQKKTDQRKRHCKNGMRKFYER